MITKLEGKIVEPFVFIIITCIVFINSNKSWIQLETSKIYSASTGTQNETVRYCKMYERRKWISKMCSIYGNQLLSSPRPTEFYIYDELKLAYCYIPKMATTTLKSLFLTSTKQGQKLPLTIVHNRNKSFLRQRGLRIEKYSDNLVRKIQNFTKVIVLRNPYSRLLSAYKNRIFHRSVVYNNLRKELMTRYHLKSINESQFWMFAETLLNRSSKLSRHPESYHWLPIENWCEPCKIKYDVVMKLETFNRDIKKFVLPIFHQSMEYLKNITQNVSGNITQPMDGWLAPKAIPEFSRLSGATRRRLDNMFRLDFIIGGYSFKWDTLQSGCGIRVAGDELCC